MREYYLLHMTSIESNKWLQITSVLSFFGFLLLSDRQFTDYKVALPLSHPFYFLLFISHPSEINIRLLNAICNQDFMKMSTHGKQEKFKS